ncbi:glycosyltransferase family 2 protein [Candidatus Pseudothioglobus singularis]|uniref:Glycosyl transferase n=1 Tax=Candidatus Pseudothioglobus singularis PS1 TaxID=1125411 RepID=A0A0M3T282_9GAMM|nr:glycosyltransferase family 2 protein [Candidatus Pseudothioglobus singularis]ALE02315.1 glycosyl transferase [Candidatus Pseudothioglobus singularis PS1]
MKISLIITTYNWPESLLLVLESVNHQTILPNEVIIADDGSTLETRSQVEVFQNNSELNIIYSWQEDMGFRAARSRNLAILKSTCDYIILIDGDVILDKNFVLDHIAASEQGYFVQGSRVLLSRMQTSRALLKKKIIFPFFSSNFKNRKNSIRSKCLSYLFSNKKNGLRGIKTCNLSFFRKDCIKINGFNNEFEGWGREDSEFAVRLINSGIKRKNIRFKAIQFHLWHNENKRIALKKNNEMLQDSINNRIAWCENGMNSREINES